MTRRPLRPMVRPVALGAMVAIVASGLVPLPVPAGRSGGPAGISAAAAQVAPSCPTNTASPAFAAPTRRLSVGAGGAPGNTASYEPAISADGSTVAFSSLASNLVGGDTNNFVDVFTADTATGAVTRTSIDPNGNEGKWGSLTPSISGDGSKVAFSSESANLAGGGGDPDTAVNFASNTRLVLPGGAISATTAVTFEAWFNTTTGGPILGYADQYAPTAPSSWVPAVYVGTDGRLRGYFFGGATQSVSPGAVNDGRWHHVVLASTGTAQVLWLDGAIVGIVGGTVNHLNMTAAVVGQAYGSLWPNLAPGWTSFDGRIDDAAIYRSYLAPERVSAHFASRLNAYRAQVLLDNPWGYWRMGERWDLPPFVADLVLATSEVNATDGFYTGPVNLGRGGAFSLDENDNSDIYVRTRASGVTPASIKLVSPGMGGAPGNGLSFGPRLSADGRNVAFYSSSSNLVPGDTNGRFDTFVADLATGAIERVSVASGGGQGSADSYGGALSGDGRYVAFGSDATNLVGGDTNAAQDAFVRDRSTGTTTRVSLGSSGAQGTGASAGPDISGDGRLVAFYSAAPDLVPGDTNNTLDAFLRDTAAGTTQRVSNGIAGAPANGYSLYPRLSGDGRMVAYTTQATNVVAGDTNGGNDTMAWDRLSGSTTLVSAGPAGTPVGPADVLGGYPASPSFDGSKVAFDSLGTLIAADTNFIRDVYLVDRGLSVGAGLGTLFDALATRAESDQMGLEQFYPYSQSPLGTGTAYVNLANANLVARFEDQVVPAQGLNAVIGHTYNAQRAGGAAGLAGVDSGMGPGWNLSVADVDTGLDVGGAIGDAVGSVGALDVGAAIHTVGALVGGISGQVLDFVDTDGTAHRFVRRGGPCTRWESPPGVDLKVTEEYGPTGLAAYRVVRPDGVVYRATPVGLEWRVTSVIDRRGNQLSYEWGTRGFATRLLSIAHNRFPLSPLANFVYDGAGRLTQIVTLPGYSAPDPATGVVRSWARTTTFEYEGILPAVLTKVTQPDGQVTRFDYPRLAGLPVSGLLTSVTDARGNTTSFTYDASPAPRLKVVADRAAKPWTYDYAAGPGGGVVTTATTPLGAATTYAISARAPINPAPGPDQDLRAAGPNITSITDPGAGAGPVTTGYEWSKNRLVRSVDGAGNERRMTYNDLGLLTTVTEPPPNDPARADLPAGAPTTPVTNRLEYSFKTQFDYPTSSCTAPAAGTEAVSKAGWCSSVAELQRTTFAASQPTQARVSDFTYDASGNMATVTQRANADGSPNATTDRTTTFAYYARGGLRTVDGPRTDVVVDVTTFGDTADATYGGYDRTGMPGRITDALGKSKVFGYTPYGLVARLTDRDNKVSTYGYSERDKLLTATDPAGAVTRHEYDSNDQQTKQTSPGNRVVTTAFDPMGRVTQVQGPGTITTSSTWNDDGTRRTDTSPLGGVTDYAYWPNLSARSMATPTSTGQPKALTEYGYDAAGRMVSVTNPPTNTAGDRPLDTVTYTPSGALSTQSSTAPMGGLSVTRFAFNAHGELIQTKGPRTVGGVEAELTSDFNAFGEAFATHRRLSATKVIDSTSSFDKAGNQTGTTQATGAGAQLESLYSFDALGQLIAQTKDPSNPNHTVAYTYSGEGQQLTRVDKGAGGVARRTTEYAYNPDNTRKWMVATDNVTGQTLATCNYAAGPGVDPASGYDADGNLLVTRTVLGTTGCTGGLDIRTLTMAPYDARNLSPSATQSIRLPDTMRPLGAPAEITRTQAFTYDDAGQPLVSTHDTAGSPRTTTYAYDPVGSGRLTSITDWRGVSSATTYFASGAPRTQGAGPVATAGFDYRPDGSPQRLVWTTAGGSAVRSHTDIGYDAGALRTSETVSVVQPAGAPTGTSSGGSGTFGYDLLDRLQTWKNPFGGATTSYGLDDGGNIVSEAGAGTTVASEYPNGRLARRTTDANVVTFTYNDLGEETLRTPQALLAQPTTTTYDPAGHTASVTDGLLGTATTRYLYDTTDRLIARSESTLGLPTTVTLYFYWGAGGSLAEETDAAGTTKVLYLDDTDGEAIAQQSFTPNLIGPPTATWTWLLADATGNVATHLSDAGVVTEQKAYDPYGKPDPEGSAKAGTVPSTLGFQGHITDPRSGSVVLGARLYDPTIQRFSTPDVFVASALDVALGTDSLTGNRYLFAAANPVSFYEDGHGPWPKLPKLPNPIKAVKKLAKKALPAIGFVPVVGTAVEVVSLATGRDLLDGGRKMSGKERLLRTGMLAGGAVLGVAAGKAAFKIAEKMGEAKKLKKAGEALEVVGKAEAKAGQLSPGERIAANKVAGDLFRDEVADRLSSDYGFRILRKEVSVKTPFGIRRLDILAERNGGLAAFETKLGGSRYLGSQRAKDIWMSRYGVDLYGDGRRTKISTVLIRG